MSITRNDNLDPRTPKNLDKRYGPYADIATALAAVPEAYRAQGLTIGIIDGISVVDYHFKSGTGDVDLVVKIGSDEVSTAGATMNTDQDLSANSYFLNEDEMTSKSDIKVPSQNSVRNYLRYNFQMASRIKYRVDAATTGPIVLSGFQTIDDIPTPSRILVKDQVDATENGIYSQGGGPWTREDDFDADPDNLFAHKVFNGDQIHVNAGTVNGGKTFRVSSNGFSYLGGHLIGTSDIDFTESYEEGADITDNENVGVAIDNGSLHTTPTGTEFVGILDDMAGNELKKTTINDIIALAPGGGSDWTDVLMFSELVTEVGNTTQKIRLMSDLTADQNITWTDGYIPEIDFNGYTIDWGGSDSPLTAPYHIDFGAPISKTGLVEMSFNGFGGHQVAGGNIFVNNNSNVVRTGLGFIKYVNNGSANVYSQGPMNYKDCYLELTDDNTFGAFFYSSTANDLFGAVELVGGGTSCNLTFYSNGGSVEQLILSGFFSTTGSAFYNGGGSYDLIGSIINQGAGTIGVTLNGKVGNVITTSTGNTNIVNLSALPIFDCDPDFMGHRLSAVLGDPTPSVDSIGVTTLYSEPYRHAYLPVKSSNDLSASHNAYLTSSTPIPIGTLSGANKPCAIFRYDAGGYVDFEVVEYADKAALDADLVRDNYGVWVKSSDYSRTLHGGFYTTSATETEDSAQKRYVDNVCNLVDRVQEKIISSVSSTYNSTTPRPFDNNPDNGIFRFTILPGQVWDLDVMGVGYNSGNGSGLFCHVGYNSTNTIDANSRGGIYCGSADNGSQQGAANLKKIIDRGYHAAYPLEYTSGYTVTYLYASGTTRTGISSIIKN